MGLALPLACASIALGIAACSGEDFSGGNAGAGGTSGNGGSSASGGSSGSASGGSSGSGNGGASGSGNGGASGSGNGGASGSGNGGDAGSGNGGDAGSGNGGDAGSGNGGSAGNGGTGVYTGEMPYGTGVCPASKPSNNDSCDQPMHCCWGFAPEKPMTCNAISLADGGVIAGSWGENSNGRCCPAEAPTVGHQCDTLPAIGKCCYDVGGFTCPVHGVWESASCN